MTFHMQKGRRLFVDQGWFLSAGFPLTRMAAAARCSPWTLLVSCDGGCSLTLQVTVSSWLTDDAWSSQLSATLDCWDTSAVPSVPRRPSSIFFAAVLHLLLFKLVWPLRWVLFEVSLITAGPSLSVEPPLPSLMRFLSRLADSFSGFTGMNKGGDGDDLMVPTFGTKSNKGGKIGIWGNQISVPRVNKRVLNKLYKEM